MVDENTILPSIVDISQAFYDFVADIKIALPSVRVMGLDSSRNQDPLPEFGIKLTLDEITIDTTRPTPMAGQQVAEPSQDTNDYIYEGELFTDIPDGHTFRYPLPLILEYGIRTWCYSAQEQISLDYQLMTRIPDRGVLYLPINSTEYQFPIRLDVIDTLDDLRDNLRERIYRYVMEVWVESPIADRDTNIITTSNIEVYDGDSIDDIQKKLMEIVTVAEQQP